MHIHECVVIKFIKTVAHMSDIVVNYLSDIMIGDKPSHSVFSLQYIYISCMQIGTVFACLDTLYQ